jgi:hypothetical protein
METARATLAEFIAKHGITFTYATAAENPHMSDMGKGASHWTVTLKRGGESLSTPYSMGAGHKRWKLLGGADIHERIMVGRLSAEDRKVLDYKPGQRLTYGLIGGRYTVLQKEAISLLSEPTPPDVESVLDCLKSDASSYDGARNFEEWAAEMGGDSDSRKLERAYRACGDTAHQLRILLGADGYAELMECEQL